MLNNKANVEELVKADPILSNTLVSENLSSDDDEGAIARGSSDLISTVEEDTLYDETEIKK